jgi:transcriptional regulator of heat shock response
MASATEVADYLMLKMEKSDWLQTASGYDFYVNVLEQVDENTKPRWLLTRLREASMGLFGEIQDTIERAADLLDV